MMNWRSRPLALFLPIAFLFLPQSEGAWARGGAIGTATTMASITPLTITSSGLDIRMAPPRADMARQLGAGKRSSPARPCFPPRRRPRGRPAEMPSKVESPRRRALSTATCGWRWRVPSSLRSSRARLGRGPEGPPRAVWQAGALSRRKDERRTGEKAPWHMSSPSLAST